MRMGIRTTGEFKPNEKHKASPDVNPCRADHTFLSGQGGEVYNGSKACCLAFPFFCLDQTTAEGGARGVSLLTP